MSQFFQMHEANPQPRLLRQAVHILKEGAVIVYPTDSCYALGCHIGNKAAMERIRAIRRLDPRHEFTLVCRDLSEISMYAKIENQSYRLLKALTPGPYTFVLKATHEVPRRLQNPRRKTIGIRVPDHVIAQALLEELGQPMMSSSLIMPNEGLPMTDPLTIRKRLEHQVDLVVDGGGCGVDLTTVIDLVSGEPIVIREGKGPVDWLEQH